MTYIIYIDIEIIVVIQFSCSVVSDSLWSYGLQHARLPCPSPVPEACSNLCPSSWWCHPAISSSKCRDTRNVTEAVICLFGLLKGQAKAEAVFGWILRLSQTFVVVESLSRVWLFCDPMAYSPPGSSVHGNFPEYWCGLTYPSLEESS